jgi:uncharacterized membrane protein YqjE
MAEGETSAGVGLTRLRRIGSTLLGVVQTRIELFGLELREEKLRLAESLIWAAGLFFFGQIALLLLTMALVLVFREHAVLVLLLFGFVYAGMAVGCGLALRQRLKNRPSPFSGTVEELKKDREWLTLNN